MLIFAPYIVSIILFYEIKFRVILCKDKIIAKTKTLNLKEATNDGNISSSTLIINDSCFKNH